MALEKSVERTKRLLFEPFDLTKWLTLGFVAFLATLGEGRIGVPGVGHSPGGREVRELAKFAEQNFPLVVGAGAALVAVGVALGTLLLWVSSRGKFMFLDAVVHDQPAVVEPWQRFAELGKSLFGWRFLLAAASLLLVAGPLVAGIAVAWSDLRSSQFGADAWLGVAVGSVALLPALAVAILSALLDDFVVPTMYLQAARVTPAWRTIWRELVSAHTRSVVVFYLARVAVALGVATIAVVVTFATCCVAALPYISSVVLLPLSVFTRCFSLQFLEQLGAAWSGLSPDEWREPWVDPGYRFPSSPRL